MAEIARQPDAIRRAAAAAVEQADAIAALGHELRCRSRVVLTGMGSSYDACYPAATLLKSGFIPLPQEFSVICGWPEPGLPLEGVKRLYLHLR